MSDFKSGLTRRRAILLAAAAVPFSAGCSSLRAVQPQGSPAHTALTELERSLSGRLGVFALDTANGAQVAYRDNERFPMCSTFKLLLVSALLKQSQKNPELLTRRIHFGQPDMVAYAPITEKHLADGMTIAELCAAALQYSDNTAANLLIRTVGSPEAVTAYARSIGDDSFRLDRWETELNTAIPGDPRDTTTPRAMALSLRRVLFEGALGAPQRLQLEEWLRGNTTGAARIRAGVPDEWKVGDKTGTGSFGSANDVGVVWPPNRAPIIVVIYTTRKDQAAEARNDIIASATRVVVNQLA